MLAPTVAHLSFVRDDGQPLDFIPGQFVQVHFEYADGTATKRSYSLATIHDHALGPGETVEIAVSYVAGGAATALFEGLDEGGNVHASGPYGRFCLMPADANQRYLLIGTGTGITPYRAMLPLLEQADRRARHRGGAAVRRAHAAGTAVRRRVPRLRRPASEFPLRALLLARTARSRLAARARRRAPRLRAAVPRRIRARPGSATSPTCAAIPNMVDACFEALKEHGLPVPQIRREKYVSSK